MDIAKCLKHLRMKKGWTQADLHRASGYERAYISKLESGRVQNIGVQTAIRICRAFGISVEKFAELCEKFNKKPDGQGRKPQKRRQYMPRRAKK